MPFKPIQQNPKIVIKKLAGGTSAKDLNDTYGYMAIVDGTVFANGTMTHIFSIARKI